MFFLPSRFSTFASNAFYGGPKKIFFAQICKVYKINIGRGRLSRFLGDDSILFFGGCSKNFQEEVLYEVESSYSLIELLYGE